MASSQETTRADRSRRRSASRRGPCAY